MSSKVVMKNWTLTNTMAFLIAYVLYTPVAHGFTGNHGRELSTSQLISHSIALAMVASIVSWLKDMFSNPI